MNLQPINYYYKTFVKQLNSIDYFKLLTIVLFCLLPISHKSIEIIRYIFIALSLTQIKLLKKAMLSRGSIILCLFIFVIIISNIVNKSFALHIDRPLNWLIAYLIGYLSIIRNNDKNIIEISINCLSVILILQFFYYLYIKGIPDRYDAGLNAPNQIAIIVLAPLFFSFYKLLIYIRDANKDPISFAKLVLHLTRSILFYIILICTQARTTLILNTFLLLTMPCFIFDTKKITYIIFIGIFSIIIVSLSAPSHIKQRFIYSVINYKNDPSFQERFPIWFSAIKCISKNPIFGGGMDSFRKCYENNFYEYIKLHPNQPYIKTTNNAHNFFLHFLVETGILGLLLISSLFFIAISYALSINNYRYLAYALFGSLCGFMMNMNFYIREISTLLMVIIGWIFALQLNNDTTEQQRC